MEEKVIIRSNPISTKSFVIRMIVSLLITDTLLLILFGIIAIPLGIIAILLAIIAIPFIIAILDLLVFWIGYHFNVETHPNLTVTDRRVYGTNRSGKKFEIPLDAITYTTTRFKYVNVAFANTRIFIRYRIIDPNGVPIFGAVSFFNFSNAKQICNALRYLIDETKAQKNTSNTNKSDKAKNNTSNPNESDKAKNNTNTSDETDKIMKYKELFDKGIITEEEFEKKKKELLGL